MSIKTPMIVDFYPLFLHATMTNRRDVIDFLLENNYADVNETKTFDEISRRGFDGSGL